MPRRVSSEVIRCATPGCGFMIIQNGAGEWIRFVIAAAAVHPRICLPTGGAHTPPATVQEKAS